MDETKGINVGDIVDIHFNQSRSIFMAQVIYTPCATGDCFKLLKNGRKINVQNYDYMIESEKL